MKNKILALLIAFSFVIGVIGFFLCIISYTYNFIIVSLALCILYYLYILYKVWLEIFNEKNNN